MAIQGYCKARYFSSTAGHGHGHHASWSTSPPSSPSLDVCSTLQWCTDCGPAKRRQGRPQNLPQPHHARHSSRDPALRTHPLRGRRHVGLACRDTLAQSEGELPHTSCFAEFFQDLHVYNPAAMAWTDLSTAASGTPPPARGFHGFTSAGGKLYVHGGFDGYTGLSATVCSGS
jgi:hypothetical protein